MLSIHAGYGQYSGIRGRMAERMTSGYEQYTSGVSTTKKCHTQFPSQKSGTVRLLVDFISVLSS